MNSERAFLTIGGVIVSAVIVMRFDRCSGWSMLIILLLVLGAMARQIRRG